jgi:iron complex transport system substrate-binding protein
VGGVRIVSLLPSATEIVCALGLREQLVGRSHECDWPADVVELPAVSLARIDSAALDSAAIDAEVARAIGAGEELYGIDEALLAELAPDLIVTQSLCTVCAVSGGTVRALSAGRDPAPTVLELEPDGIDGIIESVRIVARAASVDEAGDRVAAKLRARLDAIGAVAKVAERPRVVVLEWLDPPFAAGHWVPEMVELAGGREMLGQPREPSFRTTWNDVRAAEPEIVVLAPCGYGIKETGARALADGVLAELAETPAGRSGEIYAVDANAYFSRPGPRVLDAILLLCATLHGADDPLFAPDVDTSALIGGEPLDLAAWRLGHQVQSPQ